MMIASDCEYHASCHDTPAGMIRRGALTNLFDKQEVRRSPLRSATLTFREAEWLAQI
jgi:hypothetical protein